MKTLSARLAHSKAIISLQRIISTFVFVFLSGTILAQTVSIQGVLRDPNGRSVDDGSYTVTFKIYDASTGGTALWTDTYTSLQTKHGVFQANLGEQTSLDGLGFDTPYYVGVTVDPYAEMTPRIALTIYPYAKAILGQDNKFPSTGNVEMDTDDFIIHEGELRIEGASGLIRFNDGTTLNTANLSGPAGSLANPTDANINADQDADFSGAINFQTRGTTRATISNDGNATFNGQLNTAFALSSGTYNTSIGSLNLYGPDAASASGGQLNLFTSDTRATEKWFMQPVENDLVLGHETGGNFPSVATFSSTKVDFENDVVAKGNISSKLDISAGEDDAVAGFLNLYGSAAGSSQGGRVNFFKAADHDNNDGLQERWFMEAINDDLRIGNVFVDNNVMSFRNDGNIGIGVGASDPQVDFAIGDHDTGLNWVSDGAFNLMQNGNQALSVGNNGRIGIGDNTPTEAQLVVRGSATNDHGSYAYINIGGGAAAVAPAGSSWQYSIWTESRVGCSEINVFSDERIKKVIGLSNSQKDLITLQKIRITDYKYIDQVENGDETYKKVIAQQVEEVMPEAVNKNSEFIPSVYELSEKLKFDESKQILIVKTSKEHGFEKGDIVKLIVEGEILEVNVLSVENEKTFIVTSDQQYEKVFVYGKKVDDFRNVDYDAISMLNVSATQELAKQVAALQIENEALKKKLEKIDLLEAKLNALLDPADASSDVQVGKE